MIHLETEQLRLRSFKPEDEKVMLAINQDPKVMEYFPSMPDANETRAFLARNQQQQAQYGYSLYAVEHKACGNMIGFVGLNRVGFAIPSLVPGTPGLIEIGWRLAQSHWGRGYATEAAKAVLHYAFATLEIHELISFTATINHASRRVMEKIGLRHNLVDDFKHPAIDATSPLHDHVLYRLSREKYLATI